MKSKTTLFLAVPRQNRSVAANPVPRIATVQTSKAPSREANRENCSLLKPHSRGWSYLRQLRESLFSRISCLSIFCLLVTAACWQTEAQTLSVTTTVMAGGTVGTGYAVGLAASGGQTAYTWSVSSGSLPTGLAINATAGSIFGTPTTSGMFNFTVTVRDSSSPEKTVSKALSITVAGGSTPALSITTTSLAAATVGRGYGQGVSASGGQTPYTWSVSSGLPDGLALNGSTGDITTAAIFGTPSLSGTFNFTVTVKDSSSPQKAPHVDTHGERAAVGVAEPAADCRNIHA